MYWRSQSKSPARGYNEAMMNSRGYNVREKSFAENQRYMINKVAVDKDNSAGGALPEEKLICVPDRWSHSGWKYVTAETGNTKFFSHPNRVNSFGFNYNKQMDRRYRSPQASSFETSYKSFFDETQGQMVKNPTVVKPKFTNTKLSEYV